MLLIRPFTTIALIAMALILAPYSICAQTTLLDSLQLHYPLDGNANDESGNGFDGTIFNAVPTTDRYGNDSAAYDFDGSGDWIDSDETFDYQERSVMAWAYLESFTTDQYIFTQDAAALNYGALAFRLNQDDLRGNCGGEAAILIEGQISTPQWVHVALIRDANNTYIYHNGVLVHTGTASGNGSFSSPNLDFIIGVDRTETGRFFNGKVDDVRIYNRVLTAEEIGQLYCDVSVGISQSDTTITRGQFLSFHNTEEDTLSTLSWIVDGDTIHNHDALTWRFNEVGTFDVVISGSDGFCSKEDTATITVLPAMELDSAGCLALNTFRKVSDTSSALLNIFSSGDFFGWDGKAIGDLNNDGIPEMAVSAVYDDQGGSASSNYGAVFVLFMNAQGGVTSYQKIGNGIGGLGTGILDVTDNFGNAIEAPGDLDGDGIPDLIVGATQDDDGGSDRGAIYILYLNSNGTVSSYKKISSTSGGGVSILNGAKFGGAIAMIHDIDGNGVRDIAVGASYSSEGGTERGAVYVLKMDTNDSVIGEVKLSNTEGTFAGNTQNSLRFGSSVLGIGDLNGDGYGDLISGGAGYNAGGTLDGALYILYLNDSGAVDSYNTLSNQSPVLDDLLGSSSRFGTGLSIYGNFNGNLWVTSGARLADISSTGDGAGYILEIDTNGDVVSGLEISDAYVGFAGNLDGDDQFGFNLWNWGDINGDGVNEIAIGSRKDDDGGTNKGAFYTFFLEDVCCDALSTIYNNDTIIVEGTNLLLSGSSNEPDSAQWMIGNNILSQDTQFTYLFDTPGNYDVIYVTNVQSCSDTDTVNVYVLPKANCLAIDTSIKISDNSGNFGALLDNNDQFGRTLSSVGDLNGDGVPDLITSALGDDDGGAERGAVYILFMEATGNVDSYIKISSDSGGFGAGLDNFDEMSKATKVIDDLDGDGINEILVGVPLDDDGGTNNGAVYILFLDSTSNVASKVKISDTQGGIVGGLPLGGTFGAGAGYIGDVNQDGVGDIIVGSPRDNLGGTDAGSAWVLFLNNSGSVIGQQKIGEGVGGFPFDIQVNTRFGGSCEGIGDINNDGYLEVLVGAQRHSTAAANVKGAFYMLSLDTNGMVVNAVRTTEGENGFVGPLDDGGIFGIDLGWLGDVDGDGYGELLVGNWKDDDGGSEKGAFWLLSLDSNGYVFSETKFTGSSPNFNYTIGNLDRFSLGLSGAGDINGDGLVDIAAGAIGDDDGGFDRGAVYIMMLQDTCCPLFADFNATSLNLCVDDTLEAFNSSSFASAGANYQWFLDDSLFATTENIQLLMENAGSYELKLVVSDSCVRTKIQTVVVNPPPVADAGSSQFICLGDTIQLNASGGASYEWTASPSLSATNISNPLAYPVVTSIYSVTVTDTNGCVDDDNIAVIVNPLPTVEVSGDSLICNGDTANLSASGSAGLSFTWTPNQNISSLSGSITMVYPSTSTTYIVEGTDVNNCSDTAQIMVEVDTSLQATINSITSVGCNGGNDGSATATATGNFPPFAYLWSNGSTSNTASGLTVGTVTLTVTDDFGCIDTTSAFIPEPDTIAIDLTATHVLCNAGNTGAITSAVSGGTAPYTYAWSTSATSATITNLNAGTYTITVTDNNGCTASANATVNEPAILVASVGTANNVTCFSGSNGLISTNVIGGTGPYSYLWSNGSTASGLINVGAGSYTVTVTDANGCTDTTSATITEPTALSVTTIIDDNVSCNGLSDGAISSIVSGGTGAYTYLWSNGSTNSSIAGLSAGVYSLTVTDDNSCTATSLGITITEPTVLALNIAINTQVACFAGNDGELQANPSGGTTAYSYAWSNGPTTALNSNLIAGSYTVTITDANGCTTIQSETITEPTLLVTSLSSFDNVSCNGGTDGSITAAVSGGTPSYSYLWSNGASGITASGLSAGSYTLTVTDDNGCTDTLQATVSEPSALVSTTTFIAPTLCNGDSNGIATVPVSGGTLPYSYLWESGSTADTANNLWAGTRSVTITDGNGCTSTDDVTITQPTPVMVSLDSTKDVICNGFFDGAAFTSVSGGVGNYSFLWNTGQTVDDIDSLTSGTYVLSVTDSNACLDTTSVVIIELDPIMPSLTHTDVTCFGGHDGSSTSALTGGGTVFSYVWNTGATTTAISSLTAGTYTLTISDENNCSGVDSSVVIQPDSITFPLNITDITCNGFDDGIASFTAAGGTAPYTYLWSNGETDTIATGLAPGSYSLTVTDVNGCSNSDVFTMIEPDALVATTELIDSVSCNGLSDGSAFASAVGGVGNYAFNWSTSSVNDSIFGAPAGSYVVTITDDNSCTSTSSITIEEPASLSLTLVSLENVDCYEAESGSITVTASGGNGGNNYTWSNAASTAAITNLDTGTYTVTVTDSKGCADSATYAISQPDTAVHVSNAIITDAYCFGGAVGSIAITANGGTPNYDLLWSNGSINALNDELTAGNYTVTITDQNGCTHDTVFSIVEPLLPDTAILEVTDVTCFDDSNGSIVATFDQGIAPYSFEWSTGALIDSVTGLGSGTYTVTITDSVGCVQTASDSVFEPTPLMVDVFIVDSLDCFGDVDAIVGSSYSGGVGNYFVIWSNSNTADSIYNLPTGSYTVAVTDSNNCLDTASIFVPQPEELNIDSIVFGEPSCFGFDDGSIAVFNSGGTLPYAFSWSNGDSTNIADSLMASIHTVSITDSKGCALDSAISLGEPNSLIAEAFLLDSTDCPNTADGSVYVTTLGGSMPYNLLWSNGGSTDTLDNLGVGTYTLTVSDVNGCLDSAEVSVDARFELPVSGLVGDTLFCDQPTGQLIADPSYALYTWSDGSTNFATTVSSAGTYTLTITNAEGCVIADSAEVGFGSSTPMTLGADTVVCIDSGEVSFNILPTPNNFDLYAWSTGDSNVGLTVNTTGLYSLHAINNEGCTSSDSILVVFDTCRNVTVDEVAAVQLEVFPNPARHQLNIAWSADLGVEATYVLTAMDGSKVIELTSNEQITEIDLRFVAAGTYVLHVIHPSRHESYRIIKQ
jgi:hypothetical protein